MAINNIHWRCQLNTWFVFDSSVWKMFSWLDYRGQLFCMIKVGWTKSNERKCAHRTHIACVRVFMHVYVNVICNVIIRNHFVRVKTQNRETQHQIRYNVNVNTVFRSVCCNMKSVCRLYLDLRFGRKSAHSLKTRLIQPTEGCELREFRWTDWV